MIRKVCSPSSFSGLSPRWIVHHRPTGAPGGTRGMLAGGSKNYNNNHHQHSNRSVSHLVVGTRGSINNNEDEKKKNARHNHNDKNEKILLWNRLSSCNYHVASWKQQQQQHTTTTRLALSPSLSPSMMTRCSCYHTSARKERGAVAIILGLGSLSAVAYAGASAVGAYNQWKESQPTEEELEKIRKAEEAEQQQQQKAEAKQDNNQKQEQKKNDGPRENIFATWFGMDVGVNYYEGGFEDTMTRREAALILGVRESSSATRIKEAHRKLLVLNHPDTGGSTYMAGKINEAKELLLKNKVKQ